MFMVRFRSFLLNVKDTFQSVLLFVRFSASRLRHFNASPWGMVLKSIFSLTLLALVLLQAYNLYQTKEFGLDKVLPLVSSLASALLNNTSTFGGIIASGMHTTFVAGPWFLLASMIVGFSQQVGMFLFHCYQAFKAEPGSINRMHHLQAAVSNVFNAILIVSMMMTVIFALIIPGAAPAVLATFTVIGITMLAATFLWRNISHGSRLQIKQFFGFGKPSEDEETDPISYENVPHIQKTNFPPVKPLCQQVRAYLQFWHPFEEEKEKSTELQAVVDYKM